MSTTAGGCGEGGDGGVAGDETSSRAAEATGGSAGLTAVLGLPLASPKYPT